MEECSMKKLLTVLFASVLFLSACGVDVVENEDGSTSVNLNVEVEEKEVRKASEIEAEGEPIPVEEFDILNNDRDAYQNRPIENVPVHISSIDRYSDHSIIIASYEDEKGQTTFVLLIDDNNVGFEEGDHGLISLVVADDIDTDYLTFSSVKGAFKGFEKMSEMEFHNPNHQEIEVNETKSNALVEATIEKIVAGDEFAIIHYNYETDRNPIISFDVIQNGVELETTPFYMTGLETEFEGEYKIYADLNIDEPFEIIVEKNESNYVYLSQFDEGELQPLSFEYAGF